MNNNNVTRGKDGSACCRKRNTSGELCTASESKERTVHLESLYYKCITTKLLVNFEWMWPIIIQQAMAVSYVLQCSLIYVAANCFVSYSSVSAWGSLEIELGGCRSER